MRNDFTTHGPNRSEARPLRIAYLHYLLETDTALVHVEQFAAAARRLGHRVDVHAMNLAPRSAAAAPGVRSQVRAALRSRLGRYLHEPKEWLWNARYVARETALLRSRPPDVLLVRNQGFIGSCAVVGPRLQLPVVLEMNAPVEESTLYLDEYVHLPWLPVQLERLKVHRADAITVVSSALKHHVVERYGAEHSKVVVVPNGADVQRFHPDVARDAAISPDGVRIGFVGSFRKWHGAELLARMIADVGAARPSSRFLLVGDGPEAGALRERIAPLGDRVTWPGQVAHGRVPGLIASFDIGVMPETTFYSSPLKVLEWMAAGRAVVAPAYEPLREVIDDGVHGLLFTPGDIEALTARVIALIDQPLLRQSLGSAAAARVRDELSWGHNASRVMGACHAARERHRARLGARPAGATHVAQQERMR